jgi:hypothetical protein
VLMAALFVALVLALLIFTSNIRPPPKLGAASSFDDALNLKSEASVNEKDRLGRMPSASDK